MVGIFSFRGVILTRFLAIARNDGWLRLFIATASMGCTSSVVHLNYGVIEDHAGYVPARIALLNCGQWPQSVTRYQTLPLTSASTNDIAQLCKAFDDFILEGFRSQPYMKGFSPKAVETFLTKQNKPEFLTNVFASWQHQPDDCQKCQNPPSFYQASVAPRVHWQQWLSQFSRAVNNADALLMPFIMYAYEQTYDDRGLMIAKKAAQVTILLIDTNNGRLIWSGGRQAEVNNQRLQTADVDKPLEPPSWADLMPRLFTNDLWKDFPGRLVYD